MELLDGSTLTKFLKSLGITYDPKEGIQGQELQLLREIVHNYIIHPKYAFQNLDMASCPPESRVPPNPTGSVAQCLSSYRGMCIEQNYFMVVLFRSLGYDAFLVGSTVSLLPMPCNHPLCIVPINDGLWLVDFGMGSVFHEPIPLHNLPYRLEVGGYPCEYRKLIENGTEIFQRVHIRGDPVKGDFDEPEEVRYHFTLEPTKFEDFDSAMKIIFTNSDDSFFLNNLYAFHYLEMTGDDFLAVIIIGTTVIKFSKKTVNKQLFSSYEELETTFEKNFPNLSIDKYREATKYFRSSQNR